MPGSCRVWADRMGHTAILLYPAPVPARWDGVEGGGRWIPGFLVLGHLPVAPIESGAYDSLVGFGHGDIAPTVPQRFVDEMTLTFSSGRRLIVARLSTWDIAKFKSFNRFVFHRQDNARRVLGVPVRRRGTLGHVPRSRQQGPKNMSHEVRERKRGGMVMVVSPMVSDGHRQTGLHALPGR